VLFRHGFNPGCHKSTDCHDLGQSVLFYLSLRRKGANAYLSQSACRLHTGHDQCVGLHHKGGRRDVLVSDPTGCRGSYLVDRIGLDYTWFVIFALRTWMLAAG
jgi:hypothetical protein